MNRLCKETILGTWCMKEGILPEVMNTVNGAISNTYLYQELSKRKKENSPKQFAMHNTHEQVYVGDPERIRWRNTLREDDEIVNLVSIVGPILRDYSWWACNALEIRQSIVNASEDPLVRAHLLYINTPGGQSSALPDIEQAINYAKNKGLPVYGLIDGMACSLGFGILSMCDKVFFVNPENEVGCAGVFRSYWNAKPGTTDSDGMTYFEVYDKESYEKNKSSRDLMNGDEESTIAELKSIRDYYVNLIKTNRPSVTNDQLHGKIFRAADVIGTMVDGQSDMFTVAAEAVSAYNSPEMSRRRKCDSSTIIPTTSSAVLEHQNPIPNENKSNNKPSNIIYMELKNLCTLLGVESLAVDEEKGSYVQQLQLEAIEGKLAENALAIQTAQTALDGTAARVIEAESKVSELTTKLETSQSEHTAYVADKEQELSTANERINALETENQTLANTAGATANVEQPKDNNDHAVHEEVPAESRCVRDSSKSTLENAEAIREAYDK